jgi:hypothetical protein
MCKTSNQTGKLNAKGPFKWPLTPDASLVGASSTSSKTHTSVHNVGSTSIFLNNEKDGVRSQSVLAVLCHIFITSNKFQMNVHVYNCIGGCRPHLCCFTKATKFLKKLYCFVHVADLVPYNHLTTKKRQ